MEKEYLIVKGSTLELPDVGAFIRMLSALDSSQSAAARRLFSDQAELIVSRAPGRLDLMGGIADYSGSLVLQWPIREATMVALQRDDNRRLTIVSLDCESARERGYEMSLSDFESGAGAIGYDDARDYFRKDGMLKWPAYAAGIFLVLMRERGVRFGQGARILISSQVPEGKGVSSSAAVEVAVMSAVAAAFNLDLDAREMALLCQKVENQVVGAPCGVMDQMTAVCGIENQLLALLCQPAEMEGMIALPDDLSVWGLDSGVRHSVGDGDYGSVRIGAFMGYRLIAQMKGLNLEVQPDLGTVRIDDRIWNGFLANITPSEFEQSYAARLPERMSGAEFIELFHGTTDPVTRVEPERTYAVRVPSAHPIYEHFRVRNFAQLLRGEGGEHRNQLLGELMFQSHASYSACGLGSDRTDLLVNLVRSEGPRNGLYGAKITGGGSGGTVAVLGRRGADRAISHVAEKYAQATGYHPHLFFGSSPGSATFGHLVLRPKSRTEY